MEEVMKKLALWHTRTFRPIMTHEELEPIMATLGFVALPLASPTPGPTDAWKEYAFHVVRPPPAEDRPLHHNYHNHHHLPRPRLPFPRIDGLHLLTYRAFIDAVTFYLGSRRVADHFHVRGMPLHRVHDRVFDKVFRRMNDRIGDEEGLFVYREGTLDQTTLSLCNGAAGGGGGSTSSDGATTATVASSNNNKSSSIVAPSLTCMVSMNDIIPTTTTKDIPV